MILTQHGMSSISRNTSLPAYSIRLRFTDGKYPTFSKGTARQVSSSPNIYELTYENSDWSELLANQSDLLEVMDANTTGVTNMYELFYYCRKLTALSELDTSAVTNMEAMFNGCEVLTTVPLFDTSNVTNMSKMFQYCFALQSVPLLDTSSVTNMNWMFSGCRALTTVPLFNTSNVTDMSYMFYNCTGFTSVPIFDTSSVTNMSDMLARTLLTSIPNFDYSNVTNTSNMFELCTGLTSIALMDLPKVTAVSQMFYGCTNVQAGALALYEKLLAQDGISSYSGTFSNCGSNTQTGLAELEQISIDWGGNFDDYNPAGLTANTIRIKYAQGETPTVGDNQTLVDADENIWDIYKSSNSWSSIFKDDVNLLEVLSANIKSITSMSSAFCGCTNLSKVCPLNLQKNKSGYQMFKDCISLAEISKIKTDPITEASYMFSGCTSLVSVGLIAAGYNLSSASYMFDGCTALEYVNLSSLVTYSVSNMKYMFRNCYNLRAMPDISGYRTGTLSKIDGLFQNCYKIESGILSIYESLSRLTNLASHFSVFENCGRDSQTGAAELAQVPDDWKYPAITEFTLKFADGITPSFSKGVATQFTSSPNVWKLTITNDSSLSSLFKDQTRLMEVVSADVNAAKNLYSMFYGCTSLTTVPLFDTSNATDMSYMFRGCSSLTTIPRFDTSKVTNMNYAFAVCNNVQSGALALYQQASTQETPPSSHTGTFLNCGTNTTTGSSELAQIPSDWK
jgi:surface protein